MGYQPLYRDHFPSHTDISSNNQLLSDYFQDIEWTTLMTSKKLEQHHLHEQHCCKKCKAINRHKEAPRSQELEHILQARQRVWYLGQTVLTSYLNQFYSRPCKRSEKGFCPGKVSKHVPTSTNTPFFTKGLGVLNLFGVTLTSSFQHLKEVTSISSG